VEYPTKPVVVVCHASPGGGSDILARHIAKVGEKYFGVDMIVLTKSGGTGAVAMAYVRGQPADGHHITTITASQAVAFAAGKLPFTPADLGFVIRIQDDPYVIVTLTENPYNNLKEFFAYAKEHPGELTMSGYMTASAHSLAFMRVAKLAGEPDIRWIAYESSGDAVTAALGGHVSAAHSNFEMVSEYVRAGKLKILGISTAERIKPAPDTPTYREQGYDLVLSHWRGFYTHPDTPEEVVAKMRSLLKQTIHDPEFEKYMAGAVIEYADTFASPAEFANWVDSEVKTFKELLREVGAIK